MRSLLAVSCVCVAAVTLTAAGQLPPGPGAPHSAGAGSISGIVVDDSTRLPVRHALVSAATPGAPAGGQVHTDDTGRFRIDGLPPGDYTLYVSAPAYLPSGFDASGARGRGRTIALGVGQHARDLVITLVRAAAISGVITSPTGEPLGDVAVHLSRWGYSSRTGERTLVGADAPGTSTDDRGRYRLHGVPPGEYFVITTGYRPVGGLQAIELGDPLEVMRHADVEAVRRGSTTVAAPDGVPAPTRERPVTTLFPGASTVAQATAIRVAAGEDHRGIDFAVRSERVATITGTVALPGGVQATGLTVQLFAVTAEIPGPLPMDLRNTARGERNVFKFADVPPGNYVLTAQAFVRAPAAPAGEPPELWSDVEPIAVNGQDRSGLALSPRPGAVVSGRVEFAGATPPPELLSDLRVGLAAVVAHGEIRPGPGSVVPDPEGRFRLSGVQPGRYRVEISRAFSSTPSRPWWLKSAIVAGRDAADVPFDVGGDDISGLLVTLTDRLASFSGRLLTPEGDAAAGHRVIVFATDPAFWGSGARRVAGTRSGPDGRFMTRLPAGDYFVVVATGVEDGRWYNPAFLRELTAGSPVRITLADGEQRVQDLRVGR